MKRLILIILVSVITMSVYAQTANMVGAWQKVNGGEQVQFRESSGGNIIKVTTPFTLSDSLSNYAKIQDGVIESPTVATNGDSLIIGNGVVRINSENINFTGKTFADIPPSGANLSRIFIVYSDELGVLDSISGTESNNPVPPDLPSNTISVVTVSVSDAGLGVPEIDLSGYAKLNEANTFFAPNTFNNSTLRLNNNFINTNTGIDFFKRTDPTDGSVRPTLSAKMSHLKPTSLIIWSYLPSSQTTMFVFDAVSKNIGIGLPETTDPAYKLDIVGDVNVTGDFRKNGNILDADDISDALTTNKWTNATEKSTWNGKENTLTFNAPLSRSTNTISIVDATGSVSGVVNTGTQAFGGAKTFNSTVRATNFGAGIAPNANHGFTGSASTSTTTPLLITPGLAYAGTQNGALHYVTADSTLRMMRFGSSDQVIFNNNNHSLKLSGLPRLVETNSSGSLSATKPIISILVTDSDIISAITGAAYTSDRATITPASSKVMLTGQIYDDGTYTYIAIADNSVRRW